jgi:hypothetical protein
MIAARKLHHRAKGTELLALLGIVGRLATLALGAMFALVIVGSAQATAAAAFTFSARPGSEESK